MTTADDTSARRLPPGACSWCGHKPHRTAACPSSIRVAKAQTSPCPCTKTADPT